MRACGCGGRWVRSGEAVVCGACGQSPPLERPGPTRVEQFVSPSRGRLLPTRTPAHQIAAASGVHEQENGENRQVSREPRLSDEYDRARHMEYPWHRPPPGYSL